MTLNEIEMLDNFKYEVTDNRDKDYLNKEVEVDSPQYKDLVLSCEYSLSDEGYFSNRFVNDFSEGYIKYLSEDFAKKILSGEETSLEAKSYIMSLEEN